MKRRICYSVLILLVGFLVCFSLYETEQNIEPRRQGEKGGDAIQFPSERIWDDPVVVEDDGSVIAPGVMTSRYLFESAVTNAYATNFCASAFIERQRGWVDLNGDGVEDVLLSEPETQRGTGGLGYEVLIASNDFFRSIGGIGGDISNIRVEDRGCEGRVIWSYWHSSCSTGNLCAFHIHPHCSAYTGNIPIDFGNGDDSIGRDLLKVIDNWANVPIRWERSKTVDGKVSWESICRKPEGVDS